MADIPAVSVIIPMYNAEKYIAECLESLLNQTFQDFEVILVNDCSTDNSRAVAETYVEKFGGRLKLFDNEKNSGAGATRNNGLRRATGEYVFFMDADDTIAPNAFKELYLFAKTFEIDVINCTKYNRTQADGSEVTLFDTNKTLDPLVVEENFQQRADLILKNNFDLNIWTKFMRRNLLLDNAIFFPEDIEYAENQIWSQGLLFCAKKILNLPCAYYFYRYKVENSITWKYRDSLQIINVRLRAVINGLKWLDDIMSKVEFFQNNPPLRHKILDHFTRKFYKGLFNRSLKCSQPEIYASLKQEFGKDFGEYEVLIPTLCTLVNTNQKTIDNLKKKLNNK